MITFSDVGCTIRSLIRNYKFSGLTIVVMTMGLSLFIYMYAFLYNTLWVPLHFEHGERFRFFDTDGAWDSFRIHDFEDIKASQHSFEILDYYSFRANNIEVSDRIRRERTLHVTPIFFHLTDAKPLMGRTLIKDDYKPNAELVTVISQEFWEVFFASDQKVLGRQLRVDGIPHTIVGVLPSSFRFPEAVFKLFLPNRATTFGVPREESQDVLVYGRLKPGVSEEEANRDISEIVSTIKERFPKIFVKNWVKLVTYQERDLEFNDSLVFSMQICVVLILLLACINTANLLLSRAMERAKETAIRSALGAPRAQLIMQIMLESFIICSVSGLLALLFANKMLAFSLDMLKNSYYGAIAPFWWKFYLTKESILLGLGFTALTVFVVGFLPAFRATSGDINALLRDGTRGAQSRFSSLISKVIVMVEIALSSALLFPSLEIAYSVYKDSRIDYGASIEGYHTVTVSLQRSRYQTPEQMQHYYQELEQGLKEQVGFKEVAFANSLPIYRAYYAGVAMEGVDYGVDANHIESGLINVSQAYFETLDIEFIEGRNFDSHDRYNTPHVAVVTENFAQKYNIQDSPIGKRFKLVETADFFNYALDQERWYTIVGVVHTVIHGAGNENIPNIFVNNDQNPFVWGDFIVRSDLDPSQMEDAFRKVAYQVDPDLAPVRFRSIERLQQRVFAYRNFLGSIFICFSAVSLIVAFSGIYGVINHTIIQKTQEIGLRRAVGADNRDVIFHFLKGGGGQLVIGLVFGIPTGLSLSNMVSEMITHDAVFIFLTIVPSLIALIVAYAVISPILRSLKSEPAVALRYE